MKSSRVWVAIAILAGVACSGVRQELGDAAGGQKGTAGTGSNQGGTELADQTGSLPHGGTTSMGPPTFGGSLIMAGATSSGGSMPIPNESAGGEAAEAMGGSGTDQPPTQELCDAPCVQTLLNGPNGCSTCHATKRSDAGLDLASTGAALRLKDIPAMHEGVSSGASCPQGDKLIDSANPQDSWFLKKIKGEQGTCGTVQPPTGMLQGADLGCLEMWVGCIAAAP